MIKQSYFHVINTEKRDMFILHCYEYPEHGSAMRTEAKIYHQTKHAISQYFGVHISRKNSNTEHLIEAKSLETIATISGFECHDI
jgi:hypothetical protein